MSLIFISCCVVGNAVLPSYCGMFGLVGGQQVCRLSHPRICPFVGGQQVCRLSHPRICPFYRWAVVVLVFCAVDATEIIEVDLHASCADVAVGACRCRVERPVTPAFLAFTFSSIAFCCDFLWQQERLTYGEMAICRFSLIGPRVIS